MNLFFSVEKDKVIVFLPECVNEQNATGVKNDLLSIISSRDDLIPVINCKNLKYISSSGLRCLLTVLKKYGKGKISMINVGKAINEILEMTGFVNIFHVSKAVQPIDISGCRRIAVGINGDFYDLKNGIMVKVFSEDVTLEEAELEIEMAKKALINGIPTPISFTVVKCGESYGVLYEEIEPVTILQKIKEKSTDEGNFIFKVADFVRELHNTKVDTSDLPSVKKRYLDLIDKAGKRMGASKVSNLKELVNRMDDRPTFLHGDLSLDNVFIVGDELMVMDMASCGYGHPIFDLSSLYASLVAIELDKPGYCERKLGLDRLKCRYLWRLFINRYLADDSKVKDDQQANERSLNQLLSRYYILKAQILDEVRK